MIAHDLRSSHPGQVGARPGGVLEMLESSGRHAARALALQRSLQQQANAEASEPQLAAEVRRIVHDRLLWASGAAAAAAAAAPAAACVCAGKRGGREAGAGRSGKAGAQVGAGGASGVPMK